MIRASGNLSELIRGEEKKSENECVDGRPEMEICVDGKSEMEMGVDTKSEIMIDVNYDIQADRDHKEAKKPFWLKRVILDLILGRNLNFFMGVVVPILLNTFGVILFLRFGFIVGQAGILVTFAMYLLSYSAIFCTTLSLNAIVTNGGRFTGGVYFMVSRTLGPEFGGTIALMYFIGVCFGSAMYIVGFSENLTTTYAVFKFSTDYWTQLILSSAVLLVLFIFAFVGVALVSKFTIFAFLVVFVSVIHVFFSLVLGDVTGKGDGFKGSHFYDNLLPKFTDGFSISTVFGIMYPSTTGFLSGLSYSGALGKPSRDIPVGIGFGNIITFCTYSVFIVLFGFIASPTSLQEKLGIVTNSALVPELMFVGITISTLAAGLIALVSGGNILRALADDGLLPFLFLFKTDRRAILFTYVFVQLVLFIGDLNLVTPLVSVFLMCSWMSINCACFFLSLANSPNFRPTFKFFSKWTALVGTFICIGMMFLVNPLYAGIAFILMTLSFGFIWIYAPAKHWGNLGQELVISLTRKYNLQFSRKYTSHVKFWRPNVLVAVKNPIKQLAFIKFWNAICNQRGGMCTIGNVITKEISENLDLLEFSEEITYNFVRLFRLNVLSRQQFQQSIRKGILNLMISGGFGKLNTLCLEMYGDSHYSHFNDAYLQQFKDEEKKKVDEIIERLKNYEEPLYRIDSYMRTIKDAVLLKKNVIINRNFGSMNYKNFRDPGSKWKKLKFWIQNFIQRMPKRSRCIDVIYYSDRSHQEMNQSLQLMLQIAYLVTLSNQLCLRHVIRFLCLTSDETTAKADIKMAKQLMEKARINTKIIPIYLCNYSDFDVKPSEENTNDSKEAQYSQDDDSDKESENSNVAESEPEINVDLTEEMEIKSTQSSEPVSIQSNDVQIHFKKSNISSSNESKLRGQSKKSGHQDEKKFEHMQSHLDRLRNSFSTADLKHISIQTFSKTHMRTLSLPDSIVQNDNVKKPSLTASTETMKSMFSLHQIARKVTIGDFTLNKAPLELVVLDADGNPLSTLEKFRFLNKIIADHTKGSSLVLLPLPSFPESFHTHQQNKKFYSWIKTLTQNLPPSLLVFGQEDVISFSL